MDKLQQLIESFWEKRSDLSTGTQREIRAAVTETLALLDTGKLRVAEKVSGEWQVHQWVKKAVLLSFRMNENQLIAHGPATVHAPTSGLQSEREASVPAQAGMRGGEAVGFGATLAPTDQKSYWWDKVPSKFEGWGEAEFRKAGFRAVPGCYVRHSAYIAPNVVLMPSFVNVGAHVGEGTMVDTWVTIGSCAQIGKHCHISGGVGIGGVLEPLQANPVIIEDNCFIGARSEVAEGVIIEEGAVISMGVFLGASTKIIDRETGDVYRGRVPAYSVVIPGTLTGKNPGDPSLACAVIVKKVDAQTRSKTGINELLREAA